VLPTPRDQTPSTPFLLSFLYFFSFPSERVDNMHDTNFAVFLLPFVCICYGREHSWRGFPISIHFIPVGFYHLLSTVLSTVALVVFEMIWLCPRES